MANPLIAVKAGRSLRRDEPSRIVEAQGARGLLYLVEEDGLTHFCWKDGASLAFSAVVEDLIIFPEDASFLPVAQSPRTYVLKFSSSSACHFFWMQDPDASKDADNARRINEIIQAPEREEALTASDDANEDVNMDGPSAEAAPATSSSTQASTSTSDQFAAILAQFAAQHGQQRATTDDYEAPYTLPDVLTPQSVTGLLSDADVREALYPYLPTGVEHSRETLQRVVDSTELKRSLASLDAALRTGALQPLVVSLGLEPDAALGVDNFLQAVQRKAVRERKAKSDEDTSNSMQLE